MTRGRSMPGPLPRGTSICGCRPLQRCPRPRWKRAYVSCSPPSHVPAQIQKTPRSVSRLRCPCRTHRPQRRPRTRPPRPPGTDSAPQKHSPSRSSHPCCRSSTPPTCSARHSRAPHPGARPHPPPCSRQTACPSFPRHPARTYRTTTPHPPTHTSP